jgi:hypothetical protein
MSDICEKCHEDIPEGDERHLIYGATWCASCADDPDQYDRPEDYAEHRPDPAAALLPEQESA